MGDYSTDVLGAPLTRREDEVLTLLRQGYANLNIASQMGVAEGTVKYWVSRLLAKHGAATRLELMLKLDDGKQTLLRKKSLRIEQAHLKHRLAAVAEELAILTGEENQNAAITSDGETGRFRQARS